MSDYQNLRTSRDDGVATVTLDSTAGHNAITMDLADELHRIAVDLGEDPSVRAVVLTHEGDFFGAGADLSAFEGDERDVPFLRRLAGRLHKAVLQFHQAEVPIVGAIDGIAAGAGFSLAILPDLVVLSADARLEYAYPRIGLTGDGGTTFFLPRLVGLRRAKEILLLDEPIGPDEAVDLGLATEAVPTDEFQDRVDELAAAVAGGPTAALGATKRLMTASFDASLETQLAAEVDAMADAARSEDFERGYRAFFEDGDPAFVGR
jgi:2-(1,2-epoxy-1,2-dihydrophenyl)acetyl-CoA isomerase